MFLLIDKPEGVTSHDVVDVVRKITKEKRVGHAGTLDPIATGLLIVGVGRESTKKLGKLTTDTNKTYIAEIILGEERETDDVTGALRLPEVVLGDNVGEKIVPTLLDIEEVLKQFIGRQKQTPPNYSAVKIKGKKAYDLARKGKDVKLKPRNIVVYSIKLATFKYPRLTIETEVSSGTYIRSLARDIGRKLATGAYVNSLRRTKIGKYNVEDSLVLGKLNKDNWTTYAVELF